ncbi:hypothetical protein PG984_011889 [Apiospora sp. TS-2023a]
MFIAPVFIVFDNLAYTGTVKESEAIYESEQDLKDAANMIPPRQYFPWLIRPGEDDCRLSMERMLYIERLSPSSISVLGPITPSETKRTASMTSEEWQLRPQQSEPFLGYYESMSCFNDLIWQFCIWLLFITFFTVFTDFEQFQAISNAFPMPAFGLGFDAADENFIMDDQSPVFNIFLLLFWILLIHPAVSVVSILSLSNRWLGRRSQSRTGLLLRIVMTLCFIAAPTLTYLYCNFLQAVYTFGGIVGGYILVCAILTLLLVGREERKGWKRLSAEVELASLYTQQSESRLL